MEWPARGFGSALRLLASALLVAACAQGVSRASLVESFTESNPEASTEQANCVVDLLLDEYDLDGLEQELSAEVTAAEFEEAQFRAMFRCGVEGDIETQIAEQLTANGVADADAPCVSDRLVADLTDSDIDVLLSGEITDAFYSKFVDAMDACGALG